MQLRKYTLKLTTKFFRNIIRCLVFTGNIAENAWKPFVSPPPFVHELPASYTHRHTAHKEQRALCTRPNTLVRLFDGTDAGGGDIRAEKLLTREVSRGIVTNWKAFNAAYNLNRVDERMLTMQSNSIPKDIPFHRSHTHSIHYMNISY